MNASAPGKIILCGEYAVLDGEPAVVMSVNRRARATLVDAPQPPSVFLRTAIDEVARAFGSRSAEADAIVRVAVDTSALSQGGDKLGLGSSAAATVAAIACGVAAGGARSLASAGRAAQHSSACSLATPQKAQILILAKAAHAAAQNNLGGIAGSGADVYAAVAGGVNVYRQDEREPRTGHLELPESFSWVGVWTGFPADTRELVAAVTSYRDSDSDGYHRCTAGITGASTAFIAACGANDAAGAVAAVAAGAEAIAKLGAAAGVELETDVHRRIAEIATAAGGAAKPTGSGGGDIAVAAFANPSQASKFRDDLGGHGIEALDLAVDIDGVRLHP